MELEIQARIIEGHGVASGRNPDSPYPAGTLAMQAPFFLDRGLDLSPYFLGTLNLSIAPMDWEPVEADWTFRDVVWAQGFPAEDFSFFRCRVKAGTPDWQEALVYYPHPETKFDHKQPAGMLEVIAPELPTLSAGDAIDLSLDPKRIRVVTP